MLFEIQLQLESLFIVWWSVLHIMIWGVIFFNSNLVAKILYNMHNLHTT